MVNSQIYVHHTLSQYTVCVERLYTQFSINRDYGYIAVVVDAGNTFKLHVHFKVLVAGKLAQRLIHGTVPFLFFQLIAFVALQPS